MTLTCEISIDNKELVYMTGQTVSGFIKFTIKNEKVLNEIVVHLKGKGKLHIIDKGQRKDGRRNNYKYEIYENLTKVLRHSSRAVHYTSGTYICPFQFLIPENIPPSLGYVKKKGRYRVKCRIQHKIQVVFQRQGFVTDVTKFKKGIFIIAGVKPRVTTLPLIYGNQKTITAINCKRSIINLKARIEKSILKPGDTVKFSYEVTNDSNVNILFVRVKLVEAYTFQIYWNSEVKIFEKINDLVFKSIKIMRRSNHSDSFEIDLPKTASSVDFAKIVRRDYHVHICVVLPCLRRNMILEMPVLVDAKSDESIYNMTNEHFIRNFSTQVLQYKEMKTNISKS